MTENLEMLNALEDWLKEKEPELASSGYQAELTKSPQDRLNPSASLMIESESRIGQLTVWGSGETQVGLAEISSGSVSDEHKKISSIAELRDTAESLMRWLG